MRTIHNYKLEKETWESQRIAGRYNPATEIVFRDKRGIHRHTIGAGNSDNIHVFREGYWTIVLSVNYGLPYCGIEIFDGDMAFYDTFVQGEPATEYVDLTPINMTKALMAKAACDC